MANEQWREFKVGDTVVRFTGSFAGMRVGDIGKIVEIYKGNKGIRIEGFQKTDEIWHTARYFQIATPVDLIDCKEKNQVLRKVIIEEIKRLK